MIIEFNSSMGKNIDFYEWEHIWVRGHWGDVVVVDDD
jgi:uncharacterized membrane protein